MCQFSTTSAFPIEHHDRKVPLRLVPWGNKKRGGTGMYIYIYMHGKARIMLELEAVGG